MVAFEDLRAFFGEEAFKLLVLEEDEKGVMKGKIPWRYIQSYPCERVYKLLKIKTKTRLKSFLIGKINFKKKTFLQDFSLSGVRGIFFLI